MVESNNISIVGTTQRSIIATVWRPEEFSPAVARMARRTGTISLVDLSSMTLPAAAPVLNQVEARGEGVHFKVSPEMLRDQALPELLASLAIEGLWVEFHPLLLDDPPHEALKRLRKFSHEIDIFPIFSDVALILEVLEQYPDLPHLVLKGSEAAGWASSESTLSLYATLRDHMRQRESAPGLLIWGGVATPEAAAAFLTTGAQGLVLESLHWLTDLAGLGESARRGVEKLRPDHTQLVGLSFKAPYRLFNKGNSQAIKRLLEAMPAGAGAATRDEGRKFTREVQHLAQFPGQSNFSREELIPLGIEAAFAAAFAERYGSSTEKALQGFLADVAAQCALAREKANLLADSPVAREMGIRYPIIQGAMSWITDVPEFARVVAEAGGLPTVALGLMDEAALTRKLAELPEIMGDRPYAVNVIALGENPHREFQLEWIARQRPRFAVIAAGDPSFAKDLQARGIEVMYLAPNEDLLRLASRAGVRYLILEGNEAGGHVGQHTTLTLAQIALDLQHREPQVLEGRRLVLAGGIYQRETAFMAAMLGADAVQVGTAYLATKEIVETGALTGLYQKLILEAAPGSTTVSGETTGLRVRSLQTPAMDRLAALEWDFQAGQRDEAAFRQEVETLAAGSLLVAARGITGAEGKLLDETVCLEQGQFMSGACAGAITAVKSVTELHRDLAEGPLHLVQPEIGPVTKTTAPPAVRRSDASGERIAITGMSIVNALGNSPAEVWAASLAMRSGITYVPPERWDHKTIYHPRPRMPEKTYCKVGAFQHLDISRKELGIAPQDFRTMTHATKVTMWLAEQTIRDSGIMNADIPKERIAVLISQNSGEAAGTLEDILTRGTWGEVLNAIKRVMPLSPEAEAAITKEVISGKLAIDDTTLLGRLNCTAGGFISNKYGFMGPSFAVSAACATSLVALYSAIQLIRNGIIDAAIVGGGEESLTPIHFLEFSALGALAGLSGEDCPPEESSRPFDRKRDGMVLGEGGAMIVIESERLAKRRGARIHAYLTGTGASNNNRGLVESSRVTQEIAIRSSFENLPYGPEKVNLVEGHGTSTFQGDVEEVQALQTFYRGNGRTVLTSFKSQIGHNLGASGLNSLVRGVMAMQAGIFPATLNYKNPDPEMGLNGSGLLVLTEPSDWKEPPGQPRRLQVNSFGFGGSNYVMQLEESRNGHDTVLVALPEAASPNLASGPDMVRPEGVFCGRTEVSGQAYRLAVIAASETEARSRINELPPLEGPISEKMLRVLGRQGIFLGEEAAPPQPLALVFPGQGAQFAGMGRELYENFPVIRHWLDRAAEVAEFDLLKLLFEDREEDLQKTRWQQPATYSLEFAMMQYLRSLGVEPQAMAGHSLGELAALATAGVFSCEDGFRLVNMRAICMDKACLRNIDPGTMIATDAPLELVEAKVQKLENVWITNYNAPHQTVVGGDTAMLQALREEIKAEGHRATQLKVSMSFHSPVMRVIHDEMAEFLSGITFQAPRIPVISNTTRKPFPDDPEEIKKIVMAHLESPVQWLSNVRTLRDDFGIKIFLEVGPGDALSSLISQSLEEPVCIPTCLPEAEKSTMQVAVAQLFARGQLKIPGPFQFISLPGVSPTPPAVQKPLMAKPLTASVSPTDHLEKIIQREVSSFVLESFGRFLKPSLLTAIRREYDPNFSEENLDKLLQSRQAAWTPPAVSAPNPLMAAPLAAASLPAVKSPASSVPTVPDGEIDYLEEVISLIIEATGYERDEIEPDMDLRSDLAIRSSRMPVIIDAAENRFGIEIQLEDFLDVRTVRDLATRVAEVAGRGVQGLAPRTRTGAASAESPASLETSQSQAKPLKRVVFEPLPLADFNPQPLALTSADTVAILHAGGSSTFQAEISELCRREWGCAVQSLAFLEAGPGGGRDFDLRQPEGARQAALRLSEDPSLAGVVILLDENLVPKLQGTADLSGLLAGFFPLLQALGAAPRKKFALAIHRSPDDTGEAYLLCQGLLGLFLSAALEYPDLLFRTVRLDPETEVLPALCQALDPQQPVIDTHYRQGQLMTTAGRAALTPATAEPPLVLNPGDVIVFSGGGHGITTHLVQALAPFHPRVVLLGRTAINLDEEISQLLLTEEPSEKALRWQIMKQKPDISQEALKQELTRLFQARQVLQNLEELRTAGLEVVYLSCDVTDPDQVQESVNDIIRRYGRIDGLVHGAGVLRDQLLARLNPEEVAPVLDVKFTGAWNLFSAASPAGLRFCVALSSAAAIQGNRGQTNYAAANRIMSALLSQVKALHPKVLCKALSLPPISGGGMADDPALRLLLEKLGVGYLEPEELKELFCRELFCASPQDVWVMFMSRLPEIKHLRLDTTDPEPAPTDLRDGALVLAPAQFPLIDGISHLDLKAGFLQAFREFSRERDLWIADHKPFKFLKHPLVSGIMALETCLEAARLLYPYLEVREVRKVEFLEAIEVPPEVAINVTITCHRLREVKGEVVCQVTMESPLLSPTGKVLDKKVVNYRAQVVLSAMAPPAWTDLAGFPVKPGDLDTRPAELPEISGWYGQRTDMQGRYRVIEHLDGSGPGLVRGSASYRIPEEFSHLQATSLQYSPYVLEGLMQVTNFYFAMRNEEDKRTFIPVGIEAMSFTRRCRDQERVILEGRLQDEDTKGVTWDAQALDAEGEPLMQVQGLKLRSFSG